MVLGPFEFLWGKHQNLVPCGLVCVVFFAARNCFVLPVATSSSVFCPQQYHLLIKFLQRMTSCRAIHYVGVSIWHWTAKFSCLVLNSRGNREEEQLWCVKIAADCIKQRSQWTSNVNRTTKKKFFSFLCVRFFQCDCKQCEAKTAQCTFASVTQFFFCKLQDRDLPFPGCQLHGNKIINFSETAEGCLMSVFVGTPGLWMPCANISVLLSRRRSVQTHAERLCLSGSVQKLRRCIHVFFLQTNCCWEGLLWICLNFLAQSKKPFENCFKIARKPTEATNQVFTVMNTLSDIAWDFWICACENGNRYGFNEGSKPENELQHRK